MSRCQQSPSPPGEGWGVGLPNWVPTRQRNEAAEIKQNVDSRVVKLAFKYVRQNEKSGGPTGLGRRIEEILSVSPDSETSQMRAKLMSCKTSLKNSQ